MDRCTWFPDGGWAATIEHLDWSECVTKYDRPHTLTYLDPRYWGMAGYGTKFAFDEYEKMAQLFARLSGKVVLSINDHPKIREVFDLFPMHSIELGYSVGASNNARRKELLIRNWG